MRITIAQLNPVVGDIDGNLERIVKTYAQETSDLVVFPELFLVGYPPRDMLKRPWFIDRVRDAVKRLQDMSKDNPHTGMLFGAPLPTGKDIGHGLYNAAILIYGGKILASQYKSLLPTYDVFDEARYFDAAQEISTVQFKKEVLGISICEDAWNDPELWPRRMYHIDPISVLADRGATVFINISASPFHIGKEETRYRIVQNHARKHATPFIFVNQVGANDELIFDGRSMFVNAAGEAVEMVPSFEEHVVTIDTGSTGNSGPYEPQERIGTVRKALVLGLRDYMRKCGFTQALIGLSGGIDSAVCACIAKEAVGGDKVLGVTMPGPYSSKGSVDDSEKLARNLGCRFISIDISTIFTSYLDSLKPHFEGKTPDVTEENIQARIRGNLLMALSNKFGYLVLSTGNKSELAVGYCTLYGDMTGGLAVLSDVPKTMVYELARHINRNSEIIPNETMEKPPSAELKPDQKDQDTLPPYDTLDRILNYYVDEGLSMKDIVQQNFDAKTVEWVIDAVNINEYKRRQAAPGLKVTSKAFGVGRRMPIAAMNEI